jgi:hypothetical protein
MSKWIVMFVCLLGGCAHAPAGDWQRTHYAKWCGAELVPNQQPEFPVKLKPSLESELLGLVKPKEIDSPRCWFGRKDGSLVVRSGHICMPPSMQEAMFRQQDATWTMVYYREYQEEICVSER